MANTLDYIFQQKGGLTRWLFVPHLVFLCIVFLAACTYPDPQEEVKFAAFVPTEQQMGLKTSMIPAPLSIAHLLPEANNPDGIREILERRASLKANFNHDRAPPAADPSLTDTQLQDLFDPFYVGSSNIDNNETDANCAATHDGEVGGIMRFSNSWCTMGVIKIALHRAVTLYDNFHFIIVDIVKKLDESMNQKGIETSFDNPLVQSLHADGIRIRLYYDDCANHQTSTITDNGAHAMCATESPNAVYHRAVIVPITPTSNTLTSNSVIGKMEWIVRQNTEVTGKMAISNSLMTPDTYTAYAPQQMQFEFNSDSSGKFQSFVIKFAPQLLASGSVSREFAWAANVIRVTRQAGTGGNPGHWIVQGSINYELALGWNPIGPFAYEPFANRNMRLYFLAVAEDVFAKGDAIYKAILAEGNVTGELGLQNYLPSEWDTQLHMWAGYKRMLKQIYTKDYYLRSRGISGKRVKIWNADSNLQIATSGASAESTQRSISAAQNGSNRVVSTSDASGTINAKLHLWEKTTDPFGGEYLRWIGSCEPFLAANRTLSNPAFNPNPAYSNQVLVGDATYGGTAVSSAESRLIDISSVTGSMGECPAVSIIHHTSSLSWVTPSIHQVEFSPDGNRFFTNDVNLGISVWSISDTTTPIRGEIRPEGYTVNTAAFDNTGTRVILGTYGNYGLQGSNTYVVDINTGNWLRLHENTSTATFVHTTAAFRIPGFNNQIITSRPQSAISSTTYYDWNCPCWVTTPEIFYPARFYRWDISQWNPTSGNQTWTTSASTNLLQTVDVTDNANTPRLTVFSSIVSPAGNWFVVKPSYAGQEVFYRLDKFTGAIEEKPTLTVDINVKDKGLSFSSDGEILYVARDEGKIEHWQLAGLTRTVPIYFGGGHDAAAIDTILTPDKLNSISFGADGSVVIWSNYSGIVLHKFQVHTQSGTKLLLTHNNKVLVTSSNDGTIKFLNIDRASPSFGTVLHTIPARLSGTTAIPINWIDYDSNFGRYRIVAGAGDGQVDIYDINASATGSTLLKSFPALMTIVRQVDFSSDGRLIAVAGQGINVYQNPIWVGLNEMFILSSDPNVSYGTNGSYANLGALSDVYAGNLVVSAQFFPGDNSRLLVMDGQEKMNWTTNRLYGETKIIRLTLTPHPTDPVNNPPTASMTEETVLDLWADGGSMTRIGGRVHALIKYTGRYGYSGQCTLCPYILHYDLTPSTTHFGKQFSLSDPTEVTAPYGQPSYDQEGYNYWWPPVYSTTMSPDGKLVYAAVRGPEYRASWIDFDGWFGPSGDPTNVRPDVGEVLNPYFVEHINTTSAEACFEWDAAARSCVIPCSAPEIGGCSTYQITSKFTMNNTGVNPNPPAKYNRMVQILRDVEAANPATSGYKIDEFVYQPLN